MANESLVVSHEISINDLKGLVKTAYRAKRPLLFLGPPGIGKSAGCLQASQEMGIEFRDLRAMTFDPVDLRGVPMLWSEEKKLLKEKYINENPSTVENLTKYLVEASLTSPNFTQWCPPKEFPTEGEGILLLDEITDAPHMVQAALLSLVLDRRLGNYSVPDGWLILAAGNRAIHKAGANKMITSLISRFCVCFVACNWEEWKQWANISGIAKEIVNFLAFRTEFLMNFDPSSLGDYNFPCPRTWHILSDLLKSSENLPKPAENAMISGCIGPGVATEFAAFLRAYRDLPDLDALLENPDLLSIDQKDLSLVHALCTGLSLRASKRNATALFEIADKLESNEFSFFLIDKAARVCPDIMTVKGAVEWMKNHKKFL